MNWDPVIWILAAVASIGVLMTFMLTLVFRFERKAISAKRPDEAESILENRYALGEIDDEEFRHRMNVLRDERHRSASALSPAS